MSVNILMYNKMVEESRKGNKCADYVNKCMHTYGTTLREELYKTITWEYYKSVVIGVNRE